MGLGLGLGLGVGSGLGLRLGLGLGSGLGLGLGLVLGSGDIERHRLDVHGQLSLHRLADELLHLVRARGVNEGLGCG